MKKFVEVKQRWNSCRYSDERPAHNTEIDVLFRIDRAGAIFFEIHESYYDANQKKWAIEFPVFRADQVKAVAWAMHTDQEIEKLVADLL